ncbi:head-tail adaptor protein [Fundidesulfovibrio magnetotacticus]|uniref:head-tail adaptor protein n=1 Tax=Fundidesulfovibrio magnetotacticus TaxID=2730080 RepID=UPI0015675772|nr:head-tail adaptor protein [Fundidesulfovibrio magnetotacticus]
MLIDDPRAFASAFGGPALYTRQGAQPSAVWSFVEDCEPWRGLDPNLSRAWDEGFCRLAWGRLLASEVPQAPSWGDRVEQEGQAWRVEQVLREGGMWVLGLIASAMEVGVEIQAWGTVQGSDGFSRAAWSTVATVQGEVWALSGSESEEQGATRSETVWRVRIPAWQGLTQGHRLKVGERTMGVRHVDDLGMRGVVMVVEAVETLGREAQ